jgi:hypothetical protein
MNPSILCTFALRCIMALVCDIWSVWLDPAVTYCYIRRHASSERTCSIQMQALSLPVTMIRQGSSRRRGHRVRHVRLGSLLRLRVWLFNLPGLLARCLKELNCCPRRRSPARAQKMLGDAPRCRRPATVERESSVHAQAIADCLEFIKRSSYYQPDDHNAVC